MPTSRLAALDLTKAKRLDENLNVSFMGDTKGGAFDIPGTLARGWLAVAGKPERPIERRGVAPLAERSGYNAPFRR